MCWNDSPVFVSVYTHNQASRLMHCPSFWQACSAANCPTKCTKEHEPAKRLAHAPQLAPKGPRIARYGEFDNLGPEAAAICQKEYQTITKENVNISAK